MMRAHPHPHLLLLLSHYWLLPVQAGLVIPSRYRPHLRHLIRVTSRAPQAVGIAAVDKRVRGGEGEGVSGVLVGRYDVNQGDHQSIC